MGPALPGRPKVAPSLTDKEVGSRNEDPSTPYGRGHDRPFRSVTG